jgi:hypothetical protein
VITIFHIIAFAGFLAGGVVGWNVGHQVGGWIGGVAGAVVGAYVGLIAGRLPGFVSVQGMLWSLRRAPTAELRSRLDREYFVAHLIIAELIRRGEAVESFREVIEGQLRSSSEHVRYFGRVNARLWFPDLVGGPAGG